MTTFDLSGLTAYTEENKADIVTKAILGGKTLGLVDIRNGIKSAEKVPILEVTTPFQASSTCAFNVSGTTTMTQTTITPVSMKLNLNWCPKELEAYFTQKYLKAGSNYGGTYESQDAMQSAFYSYITDRISMQVARQIEVMAWQGNTAYTFDANLKLMNGWISAIDTAGTAVAATTQSSISTSTVRGIFEEIIFSKIPNAVIATGNAVVVCGMDTFRILLQKLWVDNLYHYIPGATEQNSMELIYPGTGVKVIAVPGLNNTDYSSNLPAAAKNRIFAGDLKNNFIAGVDLENDVNTFDVWYSKDNREVRLAMEFKLGVTNHWYDQIVQYKNT